MLIYTSSGFTRFLQVSGWQLLALTTWRAIILTEPRALYGVFLGKVRYLA